MFQSKIDRRFEWLLRGVAGTTIALVVLIFAFLIVESYESVSSLGTRFVTDPDWLPTAGSFNIGPIIIGTLLVTSGAILLAAPAALISAIFCLFYAPPFVGQAYRRLVELLAGIPSVVFGFWGLVVLTPIIAKLAPPGPSLLAAILIVALMILPTIMLIMLTSISSVPKSYLQAATTLGMGRWATIRSIVIPGARNGIATAIVLGSARAIGETMAVVMVAGNVVKIPSSLFDPVRTLTANIAMEMGEATDIHRSALFASGLVLLILVVGLVGFFHTIEQATEESFQ